MRAVIFKIKLSYGGKNITQFSDLSVLDEFQIIMHFSHQHVL